MFNKKHIISNNNINFINIKYSDIQNKDKDQIISEIVKFIKENNISFPFKRHFMKEPRFYYDNIFKLDLTLKEKYFRFNNIISKIGIELFEKVFDYRFAGKHRYIRDSYETYQNVNILTDYFTERPRIESKGHAEPQSPMDVWNNNTKDLIKNVINKHQDINSYNVREAIYDSVVEARMGKIAQYVSLFNFFKVKRVLDPSCAWGDRLIAAIAYNVDHYVGVDPNKDLISGHKEIIETFAPVQRSKFDLIYKPFEQVDATKLKGKFDFVLSSPAPFEGDVYGFREGQSTDTFKEFDDWFLGYMLPTCLMSYDALEEKGHFAITVLDRLRPTPYAIVELLLLSILYLCPDFHYRGVIGWEASKSVVPFWIFQRNKDKYDKYRKEFAKTALENYYSNIFNKIKK
jgi:hypothetical protein